MSRARLLAVASTAQLGTGILGMALAVKRHHAYDFLFLHGDSDHTARDSILMGTAFSAPIVMLAAQSVLTARLMWGSAESTERMLGALGAAMVPGYLGEARVRQLLRRPNHDSLESPLVMVALILAATMAALGLTSRQRP